MTAPDHGGVIITLRDIYQLVVGLTARVDTALSEHRRVDQAVTEHARDIGDHEDRLRVLERARWPIASATALIALGSLTVAILVALYGPAGK